jgi:hypothetical protein
MTYHHSPLIPTAISGSLPVRGVPGLSPRLETLTMVTTETNWHFANSGMVDCVYNADGRRLAEMIGPHGHEHGRLMAASPKLLEACKAISEFWDEAEADGLDTPLHPDALIGGQPNECDPVTIRDVLKAAIAAATGR